MADQEKHAVDVDDLLEEVQVACNTAFFMRLHPIVYASAARREQLFQMGAYRDRVIRGFQSRRELREFFSDTRDAKEAFEAGYEPGVLIADGKELQFPRHELRDR